MHDELREPQGTETFAGRADAPTLPSAAHDSLEQEFWSKPPSFGVFVLEGAFAVLGLWRALKDGEIWLLLAVAFAVAVTIAARLRHKRLRLAAGPYGLILERGDLIVTVVWKDIRCLVVDSSPGMAMLYRNLDDATTVNLSEFAEPEEVRDAIANHLPWLEPITEPATGLASVVTVSVLCIIGLVAAALLLESCFDLALYMAAGAACGLALGVLLAVLVRRSLRAWRWIGRACVILAGVSLVVALYWAGALLYRSHEDVVWRALVVVLGFVGGLLSVKSVIAHGLWKRRRRDSVARYFREGQPAGGATAD